MITKVKVRIKNGNSIITIEAPVKHSKPINTYSKEHICNHVIMKSGFEGYPDDCELVSLEQIENGE